MELPFPVQYNILCALCVGTMENKMTTIFVASYMQQRDAWIIPTGWSAPFIMYGAFHREEKKGNLQPILRREQGWERQTMIWLIIKYDIAAAMTNEPIIGGASWQFLE